MERVRGTADIPITPEGRKEVEIWAQWFKAQGRLDFIYHSSLLRDVQTAQILAKPSRALLVDLGSALFPQNQGILQGRPKESAELALGHFQNLPSLAPPGGVSLNDFKRVFLPTFWSILQESRNLRIGWISHGSNVQLANAWLSAGAPADFRINPGALGAQVAPNSVLFVNPADGLKPFHIFNPGDKVLLTNGLYSIRHGRTAWSSEG